MKIRKEDTVCQFYGNIYKNLILKYNTSPLSSLAWCEEEAYSVTEMENNLRLFEKSQISLKVNSSDVC